MAGASAAAIAAQYIAPAAMAAGTGILGSILGKNAADANLQYTKDFNDALMEREDNYMQRRVSDFTSAGFSPLAALEGASNYSSTVSVPQIDSSAFTGPLVSGFNQAANSLSSSFGTKMSGDIATSKINEERRFHDLSISLDRDKLTAQQNYWFSELENAVNIANMTLKSNEDIADANRKMQKTITNLNNNERYLELDRRLEQEYKIWKQNFDTANEHFKQAKNQAERKIWADNITRLGSVAISTFGSALTGTSANPIGFMASQ